MLDRRAPPVDAADTDRADAPRVTAVRGPLRAVRATAVRRGFSLYSILETGGYVLTYPDPYASLLLFRWRYRGAKE